MREIKFRGKSLENREWLYGDFEVPIMHGKDTPCIFCDYGAIPVDPDTVCQFTGFRDIDGTEVYEGDIVSVRGASTATVEWKSYGFHFYGLKDENGRRTEYVPSRVNQMRVIGNIYDKDK